jgi:hypothetical protein
MLSWSSHNSLIMFHTFASYFLHPVLLQLPPPLSIASFPSSSSSSASPSRPSLTFSSSLLWTFSSTSHKLQQDSHKHKAKHVYRIQEDELSNVDIFVRSSGWLPSVATHELLIIYSWFSHKQILLWLQVRFRRASLPIKTVSADRASVAQWGCPLFMNPVHENWGPNFKSQIGPLVHNFFMRACGGFFFVHESLINLTAAAHKNREFCAQYYSVATIY